MRIPKDICFDDYISLVGSLEAQEIHSAGHWRDRLIERSKGAKIWGDRMVWPKTHELIRLRESELSIWTGMNGHLKSMLCGQVMLWLAKNSKVAIASLEMKPEETLWRMCLQAAGTRSGDAPAESFINQFADFADENILIYDQLDNVETEKILGFVHYCGKELGCKHIVLDSLAKCGVNQGGADANARETDFINRLQWAAKTLKVHIHLICHVRKPQTGGEEWRPTKFDVKGSSTISDMADNLFIVWKNKKRFDLKELQSQGHELDEKQIKYLEDNRDLLLTVAKQRHGAWEGTFAFYFQNSLQFTSHEGQSMQFNFEKDEINVDDDSDMLF